MRSSPNFEVLKEPRGFIKLIQIFIAIFAFAACTGYRGEGQFYLDCKNSSAATSSLIKFFFKYPFDDNSAKAVVVDCVTNKEAEFVFDLGYKGSTQYFVVVGVFCFLYCLAMLVYYILFEEDVPEPSASRFSPPVIDFVLSAVFAFFWFTSAIALAASVTGIKNATDLEEVFKKFASCHSTEGSCHINESPKYAALDISAVLGFLNVFVWCGNMWFLFKETPWHSPRGAPATVSGQQQQPPQISRPAAAI